MDVMRSDALLRFLTAFEPTLADFAMVTGDGLVPAALSTAAGDGLRGDKAETSEELHRSPRSTAAVLIVTCQVK